MVTRRTEAFPYERWHHGLGGISRPKRGRRRRSRLRRHRRATLATSGARAHHRLIARHHTRPHRACRARIDRVSGSRNRRHDRRRHALSISELRADGGMAASDPLLQAQADALGRSVVRPAQLETTALGAALMAGLVAGCGTTAPALTAAWQPAQRFEPASDLDPTYNRWQRARQAALDLADNFGETAPHGAPR